MTNGSSQGLFVIVAVVIFGIFVSISYVIFKDTLQPALANVFKDSTDLSKSILEGKSNLVRTEGVIPRRKIVEGSEDYFIKKSYNHVILGTTSSHSLVEGSNYGLIVADKMEFKKGEVYTLSFDAKNIKGVATLGGVSAEISNTAYVKINGELVEGADWQKDIPFPETSDFVHFEYQFVVKNVGNFPTIRRIYIQPNRILNDTLYREDGILDYQTWELEMKNITLVKEK